MAHCLAKFERDPKSGNQCFQWLWKLFHVNSDVFHAWMTQDLLPKVPVGSVIVMNNASFHKRDDIVQSIQRAGCIADNYRLTHPIST